MDQDATPVEQNKNIIQEMQKLNELTRNSSGQTFKRTTYWHEQGTSTNTNIIENLQKIEDRLAKIEGLLDEML